MFNIFRKPMTNPPAYELTVKNNEKRKKRWYNERISDIDQSIKLAIERGQFSVFTYSIFLKSSRAKCHTPKRNVIKILKHFKSLGFKIIIEKSFDNYTNRYSRAFYIGWSK